MANGTLRLDEGPTDIVIADQPELKRNARLLRVPQRGEDSRIGHGDDDVGVDGMLARELRSELPPHFGDVVAEDHGVRSSEINMLEDAARFAWRRKGVHDTDARRRH